MSGYWNPSRFVDENGTPYGVKHIDNKPRVSSMPYTFDIAEGNVPDHLYINKFGHNATVGNAYEPIWSASTTPYPYMTAADQLEVVSNDGDDTSGGAGARTLKIYGLDANYDMIDDTVTMAGAGVSTTTESFLRVFRAQVLTAGATKINEGTITIRDQDADITRATIEPLLGQSLMALWTVPADYTFFMTSWYAGSAVTKAIDIGVWSCDRSIADCAFHNKRFVSFSDTVFKDNLELPDIYIEKTDIEIRALTGAGGGDISAGFSGWYELA